MEEGLQRLRFWARIAFRCAVWAIVLVLCGATYIAHCSLRLSPEAYQGIHESNGWIPLDTLSEEAREFVDLYYQRPEYYLGRFRDSRHFEWPDPYNLSTAWLYRYTIDQDEMIQLVLSKATNASPIQGHLQLEDLLKISYGEPRRKQSHVRELLRRGEISPKRYREVSRFLAEMESSED